MEYELGKRLDKIEEMLIYIIQQQQISEEGTQEEVSSIEQKPTIPKSNEEGFDHEA